MSVSQVIQHRVNLANAAYNRGDLNEALRVYRWALKAAKRFNKTKND